MGHPWPWYALACAGAFRLTAAVLDAVVRHVVRIASQASAEQRSAGRGLAATPVHYPQPGVALRCINHAAAAPSRPPAPEEVQ